MEYGTIEYWRDFRNKLAAEILVKMFGNRDQMVREWSQYNKNEIHHTLNPQEHAAAEAASYAIELANTLRSRDTQPNDK